MRYSISHINLSCASLIPIGLTLLITAFPFVWQQSVSAKTVSSSYSEGEGLKTTSFETPKGKVTVFLPGDMSAGDTISGTVIAEPAGNSEDEKANNLHALNAYVVEVKHAKQVLQAAGHQMAQIPNYSTLAPCASPQFPTFTGALPQDNTNPSVVLVLHDPSGAGICNQTVDYNQQSPSSPTPPHRCAVPPITQGGHPVPININGDGGMGDFGATMGGVPMTPLAATPRTTYARSPRNVTGPMNLVVRKGKKSATMHVNNVNVKLDCPKAVLKKGERTTLNVTVSGLDGTAVPITLTVQNHSPQVVQFEGGNVQTFTIPPQKAMP